MRKSAVLLLCLLIVFHGASALGQPFTVVDETWHDASRDRDVPVRMRFDAGQVDARHPAPLIVVSHGLGGSRENLIGLSEALAGAGYVVVHMQHAGSDEAVWRDVPGPERMAALRRAVVDPRVAMERPRDVAFTLDTLEALPAEHALHGLIDFEHIGIAGHSFGAWTAMTQAGQVFGRGRFTRSFRDDRIDACMPISPAPPNENQRATAYTDIATPVLHITGTNDASSINDTAAADRVIPYQLTPATAPDQYLANYTDAVHSTFQGDAALPGETALQPEQGAAIRDSMHALAILFFDAYLRDDEQARATLQGENATTRRVAELGTWEHK